MPHSSLLTTHYSLRTVFFVSILLSTFYILPTLRASATELGFATTKSLFDAEILPGTAYQDEMVIMNNSQEIALPLHLQLSIWNLSEGSEERIEFTDREDAVNPLAWFSLVLSGGDTPRDPVTLKPLAGGYDFILDPGEAKSLRFRVRPPNDVAAGTYLVSMRFQAALPEYYFESAGPRFIPELATLFFLKVPYLSLDGPRTSYSAEILDMGVRGARDAQEGVVEVAQADILDDAVEIIAAKVKNTGAFYFKASGKLTLHSWTGRTVKEIQLPEKYMLPGRTRTLEIPLVDKKESGFWNGVGQYISDNAYLGRYTATLILSYPGFVGESDFIADNLAQRSVQFWIIPWRFLSIIFGCFGLLVIFIKRFGGRIGRAFRVLFRRRV